MKGHLAGGFPMHLSHVVTRNEATFATLSGASPTPSGIRAAEGCDRQPFVWTEWL
jgi:hypothetical protein